MAYQINEIGIWLVTKCTNLKKLLVSAGVRAELRQYRDYSLKMNKVKKMKMTLANKGGKAFSKKNISVLCSLLHSHF